MHNITQTENKKVYFVSDTHLGHQQEFIWGSRGYTSPEHHTNSVIDGINARVRSTDILCMLGDFSLNTTIDDFNDYISRITCQNVCMLWGNHNNPHEKRVYKPLADALLDKSVILNTEHYQVYPVFYKNVKYLGHYHEVAIDGQIIIMFHYPISVWNFMGGGAWCLCGHSHYNFEPSTATNYNAKILDVWWDGFKKPLSFDEVSNIMAKKGIPQVDHHTSRTKFLDKLEETK